MSDITAEMIQLSDEIFTLGHIAPFRDLMLSIFEGHTEEEIEDVPSAKLTMASYDISEILARREELQATGGLYSTHHVFTILNQLNHTITRVLKERATA